MTQFHARHGYRKIRLLQENHAISTISQAGDDKSVNEISPRVGLFHLKSRTNERGKRETIEDDMAFKRQGQTDNLVWGDQVAGIGPSPAWMYTWASNHMRKPAKPHFSSDIAMKAFIVYADFASAAHASATLQRVGRRAGVRVRWIIKCWRVNVFREPGPFENALADAADAHLILFAERHSRFIPSCSWVCDWLKHWAGLRQIQDAGLAVIGDGTSRELSGNSELILLAQQFGLNFITDNEATVKEATSGDVPAAREKARPSQRARPHFVDSATAHSHRFFGIND